jgi:hypothetical protein
MEEEHLYTLDELIENLEQIKKDEQGNLNLCKSLMILATSVKMLTSQVKSLKYNLSFLEDEIDELLK